MPSPFPGMNPYLEHFWHDFNRNGSVLLILNDQENARIPVAAFSQEPA